MGEHKKESVDMTTLTERYNRKRTPVVQRRELSTTPLVEPEVAGSQNPIAPTVDNTDETAPQASVVEPQINDYQWNQRLYETLFQKPISQEEEERRKRAASVATGIGHLGNVLSSFSNLAFAGEAPSQKLPTVADPKLQSYSDRLEAIRQRYGAGYLAARQNDTNNYQRALQLYRQDQARKAQNDLAKAKIAQSAAQFAIKNDREERKMKQDAAYKERELGIRQSNIVPLKLMALGRISLLTSSAETVNVSLCPVRIKMGLSLICIRGCWSMRRKIKIKTRAYRM